MRTQAFGLGYRIAALRAWGECRVASVECRVSSGECGGWEVARTALPREGVPCSDRMFVPRLCVRGVGGSIWHTSLKSFLTTIYLEFVGRQIPVKPGRRVGPIFRILEKSLPTHVYGSLTRPDHIL